MIQNQTMLWSIDNSGITKLKCFKVVNKSTRKPASLGSKIVGSVKARAKEIGKKAKSRSRASVQRAYIGNTRKKKQRLDGTSFKGNLNGVVLVNNQDLPMASRVNSYVCRELGLGLKVQFLSLAKRIF
jgi:ribosomal protein L14